MNQRPDDPHYSYAIYADPAVAGDFDRSRFGGAIGRLVAEAQERVLLDFTGEPAGLAVLDIGTGTGRAALPLAARGARVTGADSSAEMLKVAEAHAAQAGLTVTFVQGDAHALDFPDAAFDLAVSLRVLMHTPDWQRCLGEMCRVSRGRVIFDYPPLFSASALQVLLRRLAALLGRRAETYHVLSTGSVRAVLEQNGFRIARLHRQFVLPIALHKLVGSPRFTAASERLLSRLGLLRLFGAPVTILAERTGGPRNG